MDIEEREDGVYLDGVLMKDYLPLKIDGKLTGIIHKDEQSIYNKLDDEFKKAVAEFFFGELKVNQNFISKDMEKENKDVKVVASDIIDISEMTIGVIEDWRPTMNLKWITSCNRKHLPLLVQEFVSLQGKSKWVVVPTENKCKCKK